MSFDLKYGTEHLNWHDVCRVVEQAPLGTREPEKFRRASENSSVVCSVFDEGTLIGFGRAISDGEYQSAIYDVVVAPDYQGCGVGKLIMEALLARLPDGPGPVLIYAVPGKEGFYEKLGFAVLRTGMGRFPDRDKAREKGLI